MQVNKRERERIPFPSLRSSSMQYDLNNKNPKTETISTP